MASYAPAVLNAVEELDHVCTPEEVSLRSGLPLDQCRDELSRCLAEVQGQFTVSDGTVRMTFPRNFLSTLRRRHVRLRLRRTWERVLWPALYWLIRAFFGCLLMLSLCVVSAALCALSARTGRRGGGLSNGLRLISPNFRRQRCNGFTFWFFMRSNPFFSPPDWWGASHHRQQRQLPIQALDGTRWIAPRGVIEGRIRRDHDDNASGIDGDREEENPENEDSSLSFLDAVFSFLFGDGEPGPREEERWLLVAAVICRSCGVVFAEEVRPYLLAEDGQIHEGAMLDVCARFRGHPVPSADGKLVYAFPELFELNRRVDAEGQIARDMEAGGSPLLPTHLQVRALEFSRADSWQIQLCAALGFANLLGVLLLHSMLEGQRWNADGSMSGLSSVSIGPLGRLALKVGHSFYIPMLIYAVLFLALPATRFLAISRLNLSRQAGNSAREAHAKALRDPSNVDVAVKRDFAAREAEKLRCT